MKHKAKCERDPEKPKQCAGLKERCKWPEVGNAGSGSGGDKAKGKAKEKEVVTL